MAKLSPQEQVERYLGGVWDFRFGVVPAPHWAELLETMCPSFVLALIEDTEFSLKRGKLGKAHALVTFNKKLVEQQRENMKQFAQMLKDTKAEIK